MIETKMEKDIAADGISSLKILLVIPRTPYRWGGKWPLPPIGTAYISSSLKAAGFQVSTINLNMEDESTYDVLKHTILTERIDVIGCGGLVVNHSVVKEVIQTAKQIKPEIFAFVGGSLVTNSAREAMELINEANVGVIGEGEITTVELMKALEAHLPLESINGLVIRKEKKLIFTPEREEIVDIDLVPWPDYEGFRFHELADRLCAVYGKKSTAITSSRSCPFHCTFCSRSGGEKYRQRSLDSLFDEIDYLVRGHDYTQLFFNDELFAHSLERIQEFCDRIEPYHVEWLVFLRISKYLTVDLLKRMRACGCVQIFYGVESADDRILRSMKKGITCAEIERTLNYTIEAKIIASGNIILGDTEETMETAENSIRWIEKHKGTPWLCTSIDAIRLYPGSELYSRAVKSGIITNTVDFILQGCPLTNVSSMTEAEYKHLTEVVIPQVQLSMLNGTHHFEQGDVALVPNKAKNQYILNYTCDQCGRLNEKMVFTGDVFYNIEATCKGCGNTHGTFISDVYFRNIQSALSEILRENKTAIWGCWFVFGKACDAIDALKEENYILVDSDPNLQGKSPYGHLVQPPEKLKEEDVDIVIVMSTNAEEILQIVKDQYSHIKKAIGIFELGLHI